MELLLPLLLVALLLPLSIVSANGDPLIFRGSINPPAKTAPGSYEVTVFGGECDAEGQMLNANIADYQTKEHFEVHLRAEAQHLSQYCIRVTFVTDGGLPHHRMFRQLREQIQPWKRYSLSVGGWPASLSQTYFHAKLSNAPARGEILVSVASGQQRTGIFHLPAELFRKQGGQEVKISLATLLALLADRQNLTGIAEKVQQGVIQKLAVKLISIDDKGERSPNEYVLDWPVLSSAGHKFAYELDWRDKRRQVANLVSHNLGTHRAQFEALEAFLERNDAVAEFRKGQLDPESILAQSDQIIRDAVERQAIRVDIGCENDAKCANQSLVANLTRFCGLLKMARQFDVNAELVDSAFNCEHTLHQLRKCQSSKIRQNPKHAREVSSPDLVETLLVEGESGAKAGISLPIGEWLAPAIAKFGQMSRREQAVKLASFLTTQLLNNLLGLLFPAFGIANMALSVFAAVASIAIFVFVRLAAQC